MRETTAAQRAAMGVGWFPGIAAGSLVAGRALDSSLGLTGPALVGAVFAALTLLPLIALALRGTTGPSRIVAHHTTDTHEPQTATTSAH
ncbi:hypothetical protein [Streptomyces sp. NPDC046979]|uniref:hypothetical protein n=1 Tax=Streptomyces sp. NPDC046979 TaxID=3154604 RepID=UPI0033EFE3D0